MVGRYGAWHQWRRAGGTESHHAGPTWSVSGGGRGSGAGGGVGRPAAAWVSRWVGAAQGRAGSLRDGDLTSAAVSVPAGELRDHAVPARLGVRAAAGACQVIL